MTGFVHVDQHGFERNTSGTVCAGIWFDVGQIAFPGDGWNDFATLVLAAAVEGAQRVLEETSRTANVHFMDGPYYLKLEMADEIQMRISAISSQGKGAIKDEQVVNAVAFATDLCAAAEQLLSWCRPVQWIGRDEGRLEDGVAALRDSIARRTT